MTKYSVFFLALLLSLETFAQNKQAAKYAKTITTADLEKSLAVLASDSMGGRETGALGQKMALSFIENHFKSLGLTGPIDGGYIQEFPLERGEWVSIYARKGDERKEHLKDFIYYASQETSGEEFIDLVYLGDSDSYEDVAIKGKYVVIKNDSWGAWQGILEKVNEYEPAGYLIMTMDESQLEFAMTRFQSYFKKPMVRTDIQSDGDRIIISGKGMVEWAFGESLEAIQVGMESKMIINADLLIEKISGENVMGVLKGSEKPNEYLVLTSHYDHIGTTADGEINNGADDDGSGTTTIMELAEAFVSAAKKKKGPKRSILFMCVSGEEKGLLGSKYYTDQSPVIPLQSTVVNLNIDMIGRVDEKHAENPNYIYVIGADKLSTELHELHEKINSETVNLELDYTYNDENDPNRFYYRSDHYNFAKNNVPIIFYFNGTHADYHKPTDTIEKIDFPTMKKRADLIFYTAWEIANRENRIKVD